MLVNVWLRPVFVIVTVAVIWDKIKVTESDVANIDFVLQVKRGTNSYISHCIWDSKNCRYLCNQYLIVLIVESKCSILNRLVAYVEKSKLNITNMWHIPLILSYLK